MDGASELRIVFGLLSAPALAVFAFAQKHLLRAVTSRAR